MELIGLQQPTGHDGLGPDNPKMCQKMTELVCLRLTQDGMIMDRPVTKLDHQVPLRVGKRFETLVVACQIAIFRTNRLGNVDHE